MPRITGTAGDDFLVGKNGADTIFGLGGNDFLNGQNGHDKLYGGEGDDQLVGGAGNDTLYGEVGNDRLDGETGADILDGGDGDDYLFGGAGNDTAFGGEGIDGIYGDDGADTLNGGGGNDGIDGGFGDDTIRGDAGNDTLVGGLGGDDTLEGGDGEDLLWGQLGLDTLVGGAGNDTYLIEENDAVDIIIEDVGGGTDIVRSYYSFTLAENVDNLWLLGDALNGTGNSGDNVILGSFADNLLMGLGGNDQLLGSLGNDTITGGEGADRLTGGGGVGEDVFRDTASGLNGDTIVDFGPGDSIVFTDANLDSFTFSVVGNTLNYTGGSLTLSQVPSGTLTASAATGGGVRLAVEVTTQQQLARSESFTNSALIGTIAAAGVAAIPAPASAQIVARETFDGIADSNQSATFAATTLGHAALSPTLTARGGEPAEGEPALAAGGASTHSLQALASLQVDDAHSGPAAPVQPLNGTAAPGPGNDVTIVADAIVMPSAEFLRISLGADTHENLEGSQSNGEVERVLVDALIGNGMDGPDLDALLASISGQGNAPNTLFESTASLTLDAGSGWQLDAPWATHAVHQSFTFDAAAIQLDTLPA